MGTHVNGRPAAGQRGFTLVELLVVVAVISVLVGMLLPTLSQAKGKARGLLCLSQLKQVTLGWTMYAGDYNDRLVYNLGGDRGQSIPAQDLDMNWVNNVMTWELDEGNTNLAFIAKSPLGPYLSLAAAVFKCPADNVLSSIQRQAGWSGRVRSLALNAMVGNPGPNLKNGSNLVNPGYYQYLRLSAFKNPSRIFVFLDEHPDSIVDGYFLNKGDVVEWIHLPASYHNGAGTFSFADGHAELHRWLFSQTKRPPKPDAAPLPFQPAADQAADYRWLIERTSVEF